MDAPHTRCSLVGVCSEWDRDKDRHGTARDGNDDETENDGAARSSEDGKEGGRREGMGSTIGICGRIGISGVEMKDGKGKVYVVNMWGRAGRGGLSKWPEKLYIPIQTPPQYHMLKRMYV